MGDNKEGVSMTRLAIDAVAFTGVDVIYDGKFQFKKTAAFVAGDFLFDNILKEMRPDAYKKAVGDYESDAAKQAVQALERTVATVATSYLVNPHNLMDKIITCGGAALAIGAYDYYQKNEAFPKVPK